MTQAYPLQWPDGWPRAKSYMRKEGRFKNDGRRIGIEAATKRVFDELERIGVQNAADDVVISTNLRLNLRGYPRGDQGEPTDRGVAVYWQLPGKPMRVMAVDIYETVADNLAAIAATLEAMRAIERHGGAQVMDRAFTGFQALPASGPKWFTVLGVPETATAEQIEQAWRAKAKNAHPDVGGTTAQMAEINGARDEGLRQARQRA